MSHFEIQPNISQDLRTNLCKPCQSKEFVKKLERERLQFDGEKGWFTVTWNLADRQINHSTACAYKTEVKMSSMV